MLKSSNIQRFLSRKITTIYLYVNSKHVIQDVEIIGVKINIVKKTLKVV